MIPKFIIVEGDTDRKLLAAILADYLGQNSVRLEAAGGFSAALSKAGTVMSYLHQDTLLALDADTTSPRAVAEKKQFVRDYLKGSRNGNNLEIILFEPTLMDYLIPFTEGVTEENSTPKRTVKSFAIFKQLNSPVNLERYRKLPEIEKIIAFITT